MTKKQAICLFFSQLILISPGGREKECRGNGTIAGQSSRKGCVKPLGCIDTQMAVQAVVCFFTHKVQERCPCALSVLIIWF